MFQDLKEYQDLTRIYNESVNISEEQKEINKLFLEADFTAEEIQYLDENFDELWESEFAILTEESIIESLMAFKRAGACAIVTYFAIDIAKKLS